MYDKILQTYNKLTAILIYDELVITRDFPVILVLYTLMITQELIYLK